jgi:hypothetical protein
MISRFFVVTAGCVIAVAMFANSMALAADEQAQEKPADPLGDIVADMKVATHWLAKLATDTTTQEPQKDAVVRLDALITELEQECDKCRGARSSANPTKPLRDSIVKSGPGGMGKLHAANDEGKHWAELPPHERERILQSMTEGFPAQYQNVLEAYFKHLAEEKPAKAEDAALPSGAALTPAPEQPAEKP